MGPTVWMTVLIPCNTHLPVQSNAFARVKATPVMVLRGSKYEHLPFLEPPSICEDLDDFNKEELRTNGRQFQSMAKSIWPVESAQEHFLPRFLDVLRPPHGIDSATAVCHYVGCFPYMESKAEETVSTPNFFCALRKGKILEHALLHCSLLLGLSFKAYVCMGTNLKDEPHAWVAVFEEDATVRFWEPFLGTGSMQLRRRFAHPQYLVPGKRSVRSLKEPEMAGERRRRRRILQQTGGKRPSRAMLPAVAEAASQAAPNPKRKTKKSMFRPSAAPTEKPEGHEHDMVYADLLDLGVTDRPEEDRVENSPHPHCAACYALVGGAYFYRGFKCPTCEEAGTRHLLCYKCAEAVFDDIDELQDVELDIRDKFDFEAYNSYLDDSLNDSSTVLPYKTVEVVFNNLNMWMNIQHADPRYIFWDLQNKDYWHAFAPKVAGLRPCFSACRFPMAGRDEGWCQQQRRELLQELRKVVQMQRSHKNLGTRWVTSPHLLRFLEAGLRIRAELDMEGHVIFDDEEDGKGEETNKVLELRKNLSDWERTLEAKTPLEYKFSGMPMHFNYLDADEIADKVMDLCPFLLTRDKSAQFAVACHLVPLPGEVVSIYIYACELHNLGQMQLKEEREKMAAPKDDQGITVAQLLRNLGRTRNLEDEEPKDKGTTLVNMMLQAAKAQKAKEAVAVEVPPKDREDEVVGADVEPSEAAPSRSVTPRSSRLPAEMSGFAASFHSRFVRISEDGLRAAYIGTKQEDSYELHGGIIGNAPLKSTAEGKYFEVEVLRTGEGHPDGLCIGVTTSRPKDLRGPPDTMDGVRNTWIAGYDGLMWDPLEADMLPISWNPSTLRAGDRVGVLIHPGGEFAVYVNGEVAFERAGAHVPFASPLFGVCDLLGQCDEVGLDIDALPPKPSETIATREDVSNKVTPAQAEPVRSSGGGEPQVPTEAFMSGFDSKKLGYRVQLSEDRLAATYTGQTGLELHGGLVGNHSLQRQATGGFYFAVEVTKVRAEMMDGLTLGVTTTPPHELSDMPDTIDGVQDCWTAGYDGQMFDSSCDRWTDLAWHGRDLSVGDQIGLQITQEGRMLLFQNGKLAAQAHQGIPTNVPLYALVDLLGATDGVRLLLDAAAPRSSGSASGAAASPPALPSIELQPTMTGWCSERHGKMISLASDGLAASYASRFQAWESLPAVSSYEHFGGLVGNGPLRSYDDCWFFEVCVDAVREGLEDGVAIGVTTCSPQMLPEELPQTMDEIDPCWLLGFDGMEWDGAQLLWGPAPWSPKALKVGDRLGVIVTMAGELQVSVNGDIVVQATFALPTERPLYAVVDLIGATRSVTLIPDAQPPVLDPASPPQAFVPPDLSEDPFNAPSEAGDCVAVEDVEFEDEAQADPEEPRETERVEDPSTLAAVKVSVIPPEVAEQASKVKPEEAEQQLVPEVPSGAADVVLGQPLQEAAAQPEARSSAALQAVLAAEARATLPVGDESKPGPASGVPVTSVSEVPTSSVPPGQSSNSGPAAPAGAAVATKAATTEKENEPSKLNVPAASNGVSAVRTRTGPKRKPVKGARVREDMAPKSAVSGSSAAAAANASQGFHERKKGKYVTVSPGGLRARHRAPDMEMWGGCLGATALKEEPHGFYFEVRIDAVTTGMPDGLAIGVTTDAPDELREVPEILDALKQVWLIGFDGVMYDGDDFIDVDWHPADLRLGDRVGVLVTPAGLLKVYVNGKWRVDGPSNVDVSRALFPAVDLIGNTDGVEWIPQARCPAHRPSAMSRPERGFHRGSLGRALRLSADGWSVEHQSGESLHGTALGAAYTELVEGVGRYFEVHIDEVLADQPDGMALGFTSHRPEEVVEPPATSDALRDAWLAGFDGAVWDGAKTEWLLSNWDTRNLAAGDAVGALIDPHGTLRIFVNGSQVVRGPKLPPSMCSPEAHLYPVVDLLGAVRRLSLLPKATSPSLAPEEVAAEKEAPEGFMTGFHLEKVGPALLLSDEGHAAARRHGHSPLQGGILLGNAPLEAGKDGSVGYSLTIATPADAGETEGMAIGITTRPPAELTAVPTTADEVDPSFMLGFDGAGWDGSAMKWHYSEWQPSELKANDVVDVVLDSSRRLKVSVNGEQKAVQTMQVSNQKGPFYALLDIYSAGLGVALRAAAVRDPG
ncbi:neurl4 [Symbiodinium sp. CCMP2592]|nr:neurl4 [Symbiodinium sp. CCMP2592]